MEIENPVTGERIVFRKRAKDTNGELLQFDLIIQPHALVQVEHIHARQEERVEVVSGAVRYRLAGREQTLSANQATALPPGVPHTLWNDSDAEAHVLVEIRPALRTETAIETLFGLARDGKTNKRGIPNILQMSLLAREYETFLARPPIAVQKAVLAVLAPIAKGLGYRTRYAQYSGENDPHPPTL